MPFVYTLYYHGPWKTLSYLGRPRYKTLDVTKRSFYDKKNLCSWRVVQCTRTAANRQTGSRFAAKWCCDTRDLRNHLLRHGNAYRNSICKRLWKYSASVCDRGLKMLSNRVESCRIVSNRQHLLHCIQTIDFRSFLALRTWKVQVVMFSYHTTHFHSLLTCAPLDFRYVNAWFDIRCDD